MSFFECCYCCLFQNDVYFLYFPSNLIAVVFLSACDAKYCNYMIKTLLLSRYHTHALRAVFYADCIAVIKVSMRTKQQWIASVGLQQNNQLCERSFLFPCWMIYYVCQVRYGIHKVVIHQEQGCIRARISECAGYCSV